MKQIELKVYYPAGGKSPENVKVTNVEVASKEDVFIGKAVLPHLSGEQKIIIYSLALENGTIDYRAIPALCPHQGADLTNDQVKADGNVYCSLHRRPICLYSEYNQAYAVEKKNDTFLILAN